LSGEVGCQRPAVRYNTNDDDDNKQLIAGGGRMNASPPLGMT